MRNAKVKGPGDDVDDLLSTAKRKQSELQMKKQAAAAAAASALGGRRAGCAAHRSQLRRPPGLDAAAGHLDRARVSHDWRRTMKRIEHARSRVRRWPSSPPARPPRTRGIGKPQQGVLQVGEITIVGRVQKPIAAVDVAKIPPKLTLAELRQPFLDRIEEAVKKDPF